MPLPPHRYKKHPEFNGIRPLVWDALNEIGTSISDMNIRIPSGAKNQQKLKNSSIWHNKAEIDKFVTAKMNLKLEDYGKDLSTNSLYKAIAGEISILRKNGFLIDWSDSRSLNTQKGIWRINKLKLPEYEEHTSKRATLEMKSGNFYAKDKETTIYLRAKQDVFRNILLCQYKKCLFCGFTPEQYMIGAHIVPYSVMRKKDTQNAMNPTNGLLLCRLCDVAFENGSIILETDLGITITSILKDERDKTVKSWLGHVVPEIKIRNNTKYKPSKKYLTWKKNLIKKNLT